MSASTSKNTGTGQSESIDNLIESFNPSLKTKKNVTLVSSDGKSFQVEEDVALESHTIKHWLEDKCNDDEDEKIILPNVDCKNLEIIIKYSEKHVASRKGVGSSSTGVENLNEWDKEFINLDFVTLCHLVSAANYLNIKSLIDLASQRIANIIKKKSPEEIARMFNVKYDFTPEEEEEIRREKAENHWQSE
ncbi:hypothetical protein IFM89_034046 [Coptis chinensis]|uniref:SKP1-like protein n=1 Tax=Coptis chinensis TaxID=261450 RepID=A0A835MGF8_9MAGN|nr:hypothetical protein IFM89_034046 [Coptis chinensis]